MNTTLNERKSECTSENLENTKKRRKISSQFMIAFCVQILVVGLFIMGLWQNFLKDYLHKESLKTQILVGEKIIEEIESNLNVAQTLSNTISKIGLSLPKELDLTKLVLVKILNNESSRTFVAGGGYWPEPYSYFKDVERRSFFWSRQEDKSLKYFEDYNDQKGQGYHKEEWYVPTRYQKPGKCYWSKSYVDPYSFVPMVTCSTPVVDESGNTFKGVATIDVMLDGVKDLLKRSLEGTDSYAFVLDRNEKFISFPNEEMARQNVGETEAQKKDFLEFSDFVKRYPDYQELLPALKKINDSFFKTVLARHPNLNELAKKLSQESYQINDKDSLLISAGLESDKDHINSYEKPSNYITIENDPILGQSAFLTLFHFGQIDWQLVIVTPQSSVFEKVNMLTQKLSLSTMFLLVGLLCTFFLSLHSWLVRPVKNMINALRAQTEKQDESIVLDESVPNELGEIAVLYNKRTQDLVKAKNDAQEANETKSMFLSNMSHELRTPMHAILNYCSLGLKKISPQDDPKTHKYLTNIETSGKRLLSLLNDLLDLSKLEFGKMDFDLTKNNDFTLLINNAVQEVENIAASRHITIRVVNDNEKTVFPFDYTRILQVVINLLSNAIKFSPLSGIITIHFHKTSIYENEFVCSISDEGVGIPLGEENAIFNAFIQSSKTKTGAGGTGLGLSICQHILQAHKGRIWAQNNSEKGASFYIALPYEQPSAEQ